MRQCRCGTYFIQKNVVQAHVLQNADTLPPLLGLQHELAVSLWHPKRSESGRRAWQQSTTELKLTP